MWRYPNATTFTSPSSSIAGLVFYDGTSLTNDSTTSHVGYNESTSTFHTNNINIAGTVALAGSTGTSGQVLTSNGASAPTWQTPAAGSSGITTGKAIAMAMIFGF